VDDGTCLSNGDLGRPTTTTEVEAAGGVEAAAGVEAAGGVK